jgi:hypothetical protein
MCRADCAFPPDPQSAIRNPQSAIGSMFGDQLFIEFDQRDRWITLRRLRGAGDHARGTLPAREGFGRNELSTALLATPWVALRAGVLLLERNVGCGELARVAEEMLACFSRDRQPGRRLTRVRRMLADGFPQSSESNGVQPDDVSWWQCAWLDVMVREDAADAARDAAALWESARLTLELAPLRERRIQQLLQHLAELRRASAGGRRRVAPSGRTRSAAARTRKRSG